MEAPHLPRLVERLAELDAPLVQVWGWPGSGKRQLLRRLSRDLDGATLVSQAVLSDPGLLEESLARLGRDECLLLLSELGGPIDWSAVTRALHPGRRLIFASRRRWVVEGWPVEVIEPAELLLTRREVLLLAESCGRELGSQSVERLFRITGGWFRPLVHLLRQPGIEPSLRASVELPSIRGFLRQQVLDPLPRELREALLEVSLVPNIDPVLLEAVRKGQESVFVELWRREGLLLSDPEGWSLSPLLREFLQRESVLFWSGARRVQLERLWRWGWEAVRGRAAPRPMFDRPDPRPASEPVDLSERKDGTAPSLAPHAGGESSPWTGLRFHLLLLGLPLVMREVAGRQARPLHWRLRRELLCLAFLATRPGRRADRDELVEAIWEQADQDTVRKQLHPTLSRLRRTLTGGMDRRPRSVVFTGGCYCLDPEIGWAIDAEELQTEVEAGRRCLRRGDGEEALRCLSRAVRCYRGPFLRNHELPWIVALRSELRRQYLGALTSLGELQARVGATEDALESYATLLNEEPLQEDAHLAIMRLCAVEGRRDRIHQQYTQLCALLAEELGATPLAATTEEYRRLMGQL